MPQLHPHRRFVAAAVEVLEGRRLLAAFTVTSTADTGAGSLREALANANAAPGPDVIEFAIPGNEVHTIQPATFLPASTQPLVIDGYTQPGSSPNTNPPGTTPNALQTIRIDGSLLLGYGRFGLKLNGGNSTVRGLSIFGVSTALRMAGDNNVFEGNKISGIAQFDNGAHHRAGGLTPAAVNVVSSIGVLASDSVVQGNIAVTIGVSGGNNLIGGLTPAARNVVGPAFNGGINLNGSGNTVQGNYIGTDVTGTIRNHSRDGGIVIRGDGNTIGGVEPGARNIISGNERGIYIFDGSNNIIQGNWIGPDATGQATLYNGDGITITSYYEGSTGNVIGGTEPGAGNVIAGNNGNGVSVFLGVTGTVVQGNLIGVLPDGVTPAGNNVAGVFVSSDGSGTLIGGTQPGAGNVIAYSRGLPGNGTGSGVVIARYDTIIPTNNAVLSNRIFGNAALGIDLSPTQSQGSDGVTPNDPGDADTGPNGIQNFPVLSSAVSTASATTVTGTLNSNPNATFQVQFFSSPMADPSGYGEGERFLGTVTVTTNSAGDANFSAALPSVAPGQVVSATATDAANDTSEFSLAVPVKSAKPGLAPRSMRPHLPGMPGGTDAVGQSTEDSSSLWRELIEDPAQTS